MFACLIPLITYGFVPANQNERALAFVGIPLILYGVACSVAVAVRQQSKIADFCADRQWSWTANMPGRLSREVYGGGLIFGG